MVRQAAFQVVAWQGDHWQRHVSGTLAWSEIKATAAPVLDIPALQARCSEEIEQADYYDQLHQLGLDFGSDFRGLTHIWRREGEALGQMILPESLLAEIQTYQMHPAFLDACFHLVGAPLATDLEVPYLLVGIEQFQLKRPPSTRLWNYTKLQQQGGNTFTGDVYLYDESGDLVAEARGLHLTIAGRETLHKRERPFSEEWLYNVSWQPKPLPSETSLPQPDELAEVVSGKTAVFAAEYPIDIYHTLFADLDTLSFRYIIEALSALGWHYDVGSRLTTESLVSQLGIAPRHRRLFERLLDVLQEEGLLRCDGADWIVVAGLETAVIPLTAADMQATYAPHDAELHLLSQCGPHLATILRGDQDPLHLLFPDGSMAPTTRVYAETPFARIYNRLMTEAVGQIVAALPAGRTLRILEIGAGTGATTASVLPALTASASRLCIHRPFAAFLEQSTSKIRGLSFCAISTSGHRARPLPRRAWLVDSLT